MAVIDAKYALHPADNAADRSADHRPNWASDTAAFGCTVSYSAGNALSERGRTDRHRDTKHADKDAFH